MEVTTITTEQLRNKLASSTEFEFWNVLTDEYFGGEMIPGSRRVPLNNMEQEAGKIGKNSEIVVYCSGMPKCSQSKMAAEKLAGLGFSNVLDYSSGTEEWKSLGGKIEVLHSSAA